jgi:hypothetical protein
MGLQAAGQLQQMPAAYNQLMTPENAMTQNYWNQQQMNTGINQQNTLNQLNQAQGYGSLSNFMNSLTSNYMLPNQGQQAGQGVLGSLGSSIGPILGALIMGMLGGGKGGSVTGTGSSGGAS